jgi:hypothetical protein
MRLEKLMWKNNCGWPHFLFPERWPFDIQLNFSILFTLTLRKWLGYYFYIDFLVLAIQLNPAVMQMR